MKRSRVLWILAGLCIFLTVLCVCLVVAVALVRVHFENYQPVEHLEEMSSDSPFPAEPWAEGYRLNPLVQPLSYELTLHPQLEEGTFSGCVAIRVKVEESRQFLAVNVKDLTVTSTRVKIPDNGHEFPLRDAFLYAPHEMWVLKALFPAGEYDLHFEFNGQLTDKIVGFYRSEYKDPSTGDKRLIATSKFQPTYARQAFPCFDEPSFKSNFTVRLVRPSNGYSALSNMDVDYELPEEPEAGFTTVVFKESVPMVTYLACFIVSDFESLAPMNVSQNTVPFSVYATPGQVEKTKYALDTGVNITEYYIDYFGIEYPLPKLDMIAIPDFVSGAMEHWGLITYREVNLLYDPKISSTSNKQRVATVIAHELAHMWFGNLMTLKWWDDLWLNEGFASYMEYKGVDHAHEDWAMMDQFLIDDLHPVLILDAALSSHPIVQEVGHPDEITELFDTISYNKGAAVIRMLEDFMGEENFREGISKFLQEYEFANAVTQNLWDVLQRVENDKAEEPINITQVMDTWTRQMGFPVLTVTTDSDNNRILTQSRFLADPFADTSNDTSPYGYKWEVPITYITSNSKDVQLTWLLSDEPSVKVLNNDNADWIKFNRHQVGYYRVNYSPDEWGCFGQLLKGEGLEELDPSDRAHLLEDAFSIADAGLLDYEYALEMTEYLVNENHYVPWSVASTMLNKLKGLLTGTSGYADLRKYIQYLVTNAYENTTWEVNSEDDHLKRRLRVVILSLACSSGHPDCLNRAKTEFDKWLGTPDEKPDPDIRELVYYYGLKMSGDEEKWDIMWKLYKDEEDAQEKTKLLSGLASIQEPWLLQRFIEYAKDESNIRSQDFFTVIQYISKNPVGNPIVWEFIRSEWDYLVDRFTTNNRYLGRLIPSVTGSFASEFKLKEMQSFFEQYPDAGAGTAARSQALETVSNNISWRKNHEATLGDWFATKNGGQ